MGRGYRWMYRMTGLPGWIRFGFSPGWGGLPPMAQYLSQTGQLPQAISWFQQQAPAYTGAPPVTGAPPTPMSKDQEVRMLREQAKALDNQLKQIRKRISELKEKK